MPSPGVSSEIMQKKVESLINYLLAGLDSDEDQSQAISYWIATGLHRQQQLKNAIESREVEAENVRASA